MAHIKNTPLVVERADTFKLRLFGLMFRKGLEQDHVMVLEPCQSIHMFFMRFAIDLLILNQKGEIIALIKEIKPGRVTALYKEARTFIECEVGTIDRFDFKLGQLIEIVEKEYQ